MSTSIIEVAGFPIGPDVNLTLRKQHMDVHYEVCNWGRNEHRGENGTWNYYVTLWEDAMPPGVFDAEFWLPPTQGMFGRTSYDYMSASFADAEWHGGITYYEKRGGIDGEPRAVKLGCDYSHYWDEGRQYYLAAVEGDAQRTVEALRERFALYRRCVYNGRWLPESEGLLVDGRFYSPEGHETWTAWRAERSAKVPS